MGQAQDRMRKRSWFELQKFESAILCNINFCQK